MNVDTHKSKNPQNRSLVWQYKITIFFVLSYWIINPILYSHFGNADLSGSSSENKWLVFFAGPFSFSENVDYNYSLGQAIHSSILSGNFWIPFYTIFFSEWKIRDNFHYKGQTLNAWKLYIIAVIASYANALFWNFYRLHTPTPGTSVIAFSLLLSYFGAYPLLTLKNLGKNKGQFDAKVENTVMPSLMGITLILGLQPIDFLSTSNWNSPLWTNLFLVFLPLLFLVLYEYISKILHRRLEYLEPKVLGVLLLASIILIFWQYIVVNPAAPLHLVGGVFFLATFFFCQKILCKYLTPYFTKFWNRGDLDSGD